MNFLVAHAQTEIRQRNAQRVAGFPMIADVRDHPARLGRLHAVLKSRRRAQRLNRGIHSQPVCKLHNLLDRIPFGRIDCNIGAHFFGEFLAVRLGVNGDDQPGTQQPRAGCGAQPDRTLGKDRDRPAGRDFRVLGPHQAGGHHIRGVERLLVGQFVRDGNHVVVGIVDKKVFGHIAVALGGEFIAAQHPAALRGNAALAGVALAARRDGVHHHPVALFAGGDVGAGLMDDANALVAENPALGNLDDTAHGMHIRSADQRGGCFNHRIVRAGLGNGFVDNANLVYA